MHYIRSVIIGNGPEKLFRISTDTNIERDNNQAALRSSLLAATQCSCCLASGTLCYHVSNSDTLSGTLCLCKQHHIAQPASSFSFSVVCVADEVLELKNLFRKLTTNWLLICSMPVFCWAVRHNWPGLIVVGPVTVLAFGVSSHNSQFTYARMVTMDKSYSYG